MIRVLVLRMPSWFEVQRKTASISSPVRNETTIIAEPGPRTRKRQKKAVEDLAQDGIHGSTSGFTKCIPALSAFS